MRCMAESMVLFSIWDLGKGPKQEFDSIQFQH